ncbi:MAG TPA: Rieske (2Fe-2S) protein, partial [Candidatus Limnocylindria bacterium]|nr:Rieske (2Fe-2S) protein [Candidatus Limnocylindria bacterium]
MTTQLGPRSAGGAAGDGAGPDALSPRAPEIPLSRASTLPARYYLDPAVLELEKERIFARTWQLVARYDDLQRIGDFVPVTVIDEPIVITHGQDGELRAFYNVCRHRAGQVALTRGNRKSLQCRYHGWTYGLDGTLRACPEMEETEDFRKEEFGLVPVRVDRWGPFVFVNLDADAPPLREVMGAIPDEVARAGYDVERMRPVERRE